MKAWVCRKSGLPTSGFFQLEHDYPIPVPKGDQLLVKVTAVGLNPGGVKWMCIPPLSWMLKKPGVPEFEFSGEIAGGDVTGSGFALGDEVFGTTGMPESVLSGVGALAEYTLSHPGSLRKKP